MGEGDDQFADGRHRQRDRVEALAGGQTAPGRETAARVGRRLQTEGEREGMRCTFWLSRAFVIKLRPGKQRRTEVRWGSE